MQFFMAMQHILSDFWKAMLTQCKEFIQSLQLKNQYYVYNNKLKCIYIVDL